jgi:chromosome segregation ATPase
LLDTLIVESLEEAMPIAYGKVRQRVVTCRGEFIDVTGVMTVGGEVRVEEDGESLKRKAEGLDKQLKDEVIKLD